MFTTGPCWIQSIKYIFLLRRIQLNNVFFSITFLENLNFRFKGILFKYVLSKVYSLWRSDRVGAVEGICSVLCFLFSPEALLYSNAAELVS